MLWTALLQPSEKPSDLARRAPLRWVRVQGRVDSDPVPTNKGCRFEFVTDHLVAPYQEPALGRLLVRMLATASVGYGEEVVVEGALNIPAPAMNPGEFSYRDYLARRGIFATLTGTRTERLRPATLSPLGVAIALKAACLAQIGRYLPPDRAALFGSLLLGNGVSPVDPDVADEFRDLGLAHVLAVSGAQVLIILRALKWGFKKLGVRRRYGVPVALAFVWLFGGMTGMPPSIVRALVMAIASILAWGARRQALRLVPLLWATLGMLVVCPMWLFDLGFLFSVLATFALQHTTPILAARLRRVPSLVAEALATSVAATLWVVPLQLASFGQLSAWTLPANLVACLFVETLTVAGAVLVPAGAAIGWIPFGSVPVSWGYQAMGWALWVFQSLVAFLHRLPGASLYVRPLDWAPAMALYGALFLLLWGLRGDRLRYVALGAAGMAGILLVSWWPRSEGLRIVVLSVGQGDAIAFCTPRGRWFLIDSGPAWEGGDAGARTIVPFLQREGVSRLAGCILSHPHADHVGGYVSVLKAFPTEAFWDGGQDWKDPNYQRLFEILLQQRVRWSVMRAGAQAELEPELWLDVLGPPPEPLHHTHSDCNNNSLVVRLHYRRFSMLFAGDLEQEAEGLLVRDRPEWLRADLLKASHHGSRFGSTAPFLEAVHPQASFISVGRHNVFHHPAREAIARLRHYGPVYRTDEDGGITIRSDGERWSVATTLRPGEAGP